MKFVLVDRISALEPGRRIVAHKALSLAEEYLADHFPRFPVLPGVLMLEGLVQASAWLARATLDFAPSLVVLQEARNVTFKSFLAPGQVLRLESQCQEMTPERSLYTASGQVDAREVVKARLALRHLNLADMDESQRSVDERIRREMRALFGLLLDERAAAQG
ncbi:MAG: beta-hydroxyacyl-ACP dehydratase [Phycisphaerae bacterium]|nr:beta-hydroxyacyl-ACP dehydratase [Phycisphaerae bacterium]MCZ2400332.1 beta-hydroxyacyl-ACP dehydratase [Phycisphaerae bacterium]NUQ50558.1 beta-hydroxyacyl-ACP dehydratase [Phycisphaerae bacterium]